MLWEWDGDEREGLLKRARTILGHLFFPSGFAGLVWTGLGRGGVGSRGPVLCCALLERVAFLAAFEISVIKVR